LRALWLADSCRAWGLNVIECSGWKERGSQPFDPKGVICHHTAGAAKGDMPSLSVLINGRTGLAGPLCQVGLGRSGTVYIVAASRANHAGSGGWKGLSGNSSVLGIEAESVGNGKDWTAAQLEAYPVLTACLLAGIGRSADWACGHREWAPKRKIDPAGIDMNQHRADVAQLLLKGPGSTGEDEPVTQDEIDRIAAAVAVAMTPAFELRDEVWWSKTLAAAENAATDEAAVAATAARADELLREVQMEETP